MKLSCVYAIHNRADLFETTLESLESQRDQLHLDYELLVIDDGSTDRLPALLAQYTATLPIRCLTIDVHRLESPVYQIDGCNNPSAAWNVAIRHALGTDILISSPEVTHLSEENLATLMHWPVEPHVGVIANVYEPNGWILGGGTDKRALNFLARYDSARLRALGGFDERFMRGWGFDDTEFMGRWLASGGTFDFTQEQVEALHQPHPRLEDLRRDGYKVNSDYFKLCQKHGFPYPANMGQDWGSTRLITNTWTSDCWEAKAGGGDVAMRLEGE
jgi:hypothetical protein